MMNVNDKSQPGTSSSIENQISNDSIDDKLKVFVKRFVKKFQEILDELKNEGAVGGKPKPNNKASLSGSVIGAVLGGSSCVPGGEGIGSTLGQETASYLSEKLSKWHRQMAKRLTETFRPIDELSIRKILVKAGGNIFHSFESQFTVVTDKEGYWSRALEKLADDATDRAIVYISSSKESENVVSDFITKKSEEAFSDFITKGILKRNLDPKSKSGHEILMDNTILKTSKLFSKVGLVRINPDGSADSYYSKNGKASKYGYRLSFQRFDRYKEITQPSEKPNKEYRYILLPDVIKPKLKNILDEVNNEDPKFQIKFLFDNAAAYKLPTLFTHIEGKIKPYIPILFNIKEPVKNFTGRMIELEDLHLKLQNNFGQVVISHTASITGLGGIGKTELARKYVQEHKDYYSNSIWIDSGSQESLKRSFRELAKEMKIHIKEEFDKSIVNKIYKHILCNEKCLFIFDNAEAYDDIRDYLPYALSYSHKPYILITSRNQDWEIGQEGKIDVMSLDVFSEEEAEQFVRNSIEIHCLQYENINELTNELQYLPLALKQAVAYINEENKKRSKRGGKTFEIRDYLHEYQKHTRETLEKGICKNIDRYDKTILTTWLTTLEKIEENEDCGRQAIDMFNIISYLSPENLKLEYFFLMNENMWNAAELLDQYSMIKLKSLNIDDVGESDMHRLVQKVARLRLKDQNKEEQVLKNALEIITRSKSMSDKSLSLSTLGNFVSVWSYACNYSELIIGFYFNDYGYDRTPLHWLAKYGYSEAVNNLLIFFKREQEKVSLNNFYLQYSRKIFNEIINGKDYFGQTPFHLAVQADHVRVVEILMPFIDSSSDALTDSIICAAKGGNRVIVELLIGKNESLADWMDDNGRTPACFAAGSGHVDIIKFLKPKPYNYYLLFALHSRDFKNCIYRSNIILKGIGKDITLDLKLRCDCIILTNLIFGPSLAKMWATRLRTPTNFLQNEIEQRKLKRNLFIIFNVPGYEDLLWDDKIIIDKLNFSELHVAAAYDNKNIIKDLIKNGLLDKDMGKNISLTPLHCAALCGSSEAYKYLIENGSDTDSRIELSNIINIIQAEMEINQNLIYPEWKFVVEVLIELNNILMDNNIILTADVICKIFNYDNENFII